MKKQQQAGAGLGRKDTVRRFMVVNDPTTSFKH